MESVEQITAEFTRIKSEIQTDMLKAKNEWQTAVADKAASADLEAIKASILEKTDAFEASLQRLTDVAEKQGMKINELTERSSNAAPKSLGDQFSEAAKAKLEQLTTLKGKKSGTGEQIVLKSAGTMLTTNILPSVSTAIPYSLVTPAGDIVRIARRRPYIRQILNAKPTSAMYEWWAEQVNVDGAANTTAEGTAKSQADFDIQERTAKVEKVTAYSKMSKEILSDVQAMRNFVEEELMEIVELKLDAQLYNGNGTSPNLKGLVTWGTTMSVAGTPFAGGAGVGIATPNNFDVITAGKAIMQNSYNFTPDVLLVNPLDYGMMQSVKTTYGEYIIPPYAQTDLMRIAGVTVIENPGVTAGDFVLMDSSRPRLRIREEFTIDYGYENDDFTKNLITVLGELRALLYVPTNYAGSVFKGTWATLIAAMAKS